MRKLLVGLLCASVLAQPVMAVESAQALLTPSPVSAILNIGSWILSANKKKLFEIEVQAKAQTFEQAKKEGFRLAVEHAVGNFILSETEVNSSRMKRDEIITYASGFVDRFEILERTETPSGVLVSMRVWVAHSSIAQRLLNKSESTVDLEGPRVQAKVETYQEYRTNADRVLGAVLNDYPQRAFDIHLENSQVTLDTQRQPYVTVPFLVRWNEKYLASLVETVQRINPKPECASWGRQCNTRSTIIVRVNSITANPQAWFDDDVTWNVMFQRMVLIGPMYLVVIHDQTGREQIRQCYPARELDGLEYRSQYFLEAGAGKVAVNGQMIQRIRLVLPIQTNLGSMGRIDVKIVPKKDC
jgi:hypothetical protein